MSAPSSLAVNDQPFAPYRMSSWEVLRGGLPLIRIRKRDPLPTSGPSPRVALETVLRRQLETTRCVITFSGGRDSSALLAVALHVARREGLPEPVALTFRYKHAKGADESEWQEVVIRHLRPKCWEIFNVPESHSDMLGRIGTESLVKRGLLWPPTLHLVPGWLDRVIGTTVISGEGGDEILGAGRATPLRMLLRSLRRRPPSLPPHMVCLAVEEMAPSALRSARARDKARGDGFAAWLREPFRRRALDEVGREISSRPWSWAADIRAHTQARSLVLGEANRDWLGAEYGVRFSRPLLETEFVDAVARTGGHLGFAGRTDAMRKIFADLLPDRVLSRVSKASFNEAYLGGPTQDFARRWDGTGVDADAVDVAVLRGLWLSELVPAGTSALLQLAWLASQGLGRS